MSKGSNTAKTQNYCFKTYGFKSFYPLGGKTSAFSIQNKILNSFTKAVQIAQEYKQGLDLNTSDFSTSIKNQLKNEIFNKKSYVEYGYNFENFGDYVENPNMLVDWSAFSEHGKMRMSQRHMATEDIEQIVQHGFTLSQNNGNKFVFITKTA